MFTGSRSDLKEAGRLAIRGDFKAIQPETFIRYGRGLRALHDLHSAPGRRDNIQAVACIGDAGTGKSRQAFEAMPDAYSKPAGPWFDGYEGQTDVIIDDFVPGEDLSLSMVMRITDRYPLRVPIKGGFVPWRATKIIFTSNYPLEEWIPEKMRFSETGQTRLRALQRRFKVLQFPLKEDSDTEAEESQKAEKAEVEDPIIID